MIAVVDGRVVPAATATVPALDRAAWYGDAVFETFRTFGRRVLALDDRLARLARSCEVLGIAAPDEASIRRDLRAGVDAFESDDAYVRVARSRGVSSGGLVPPADASPTTAIFVGALPSFPERYAVEGLRVLTQRSAVEPGGPRSAGAKVATYVEPMLALRDARAAGADDGIGIDREGSVLEATTSNVFVWDGARLLTPPASMGVLPGVTAALVADLARAHGLTVRERRITAHDLYRAREVLLTSSVRGVVSVASVDGIVLGNGAPGDVARRLASAYARLVEERAAFVDGDPNSR